MRRSEQQVCGVDGCGRPHYCKGYCEAHYQRQRHGRPMDSPVQEKIRSDGSCRVNDCERPHWSKGLCDLHYQRQRDGVPMDFEGRLHGLDTCTVPGCDKPYNGGGYCSAHWSRAKKGLPMEDPVKVLVRGEIPGYGATHDEIRRRRGLASQFTCPCGQPAREWALNNDSPRVIVETMGHRQTAGFRYSLDPMDYSPMCTACHQKMDYEWNKVHR